MLMFQSLLWWICLLCYMARILRALASRFQSLLWWICLLCQQRKLQASDVLHMFQSLLWWICLFCSLGILECPDRGVTVSILVVVDLPPLPGRSPRLAFLR